MLSVGAFGSGEGWPGCLLDCSDLLAALRDLPRDRLEELDGGDIPSESGPDECDSDGGTPLTGDLLAPGSEGLLEGQGLTPAPQCYAI